MSRSVRRCVVALLAGAAAVVIPVLPVTAAHATAYRYWTYWHADPASSDWRFGGSGPDYRPSNGAVEGWRFAVSQGTTSAPTPRTDPAKAYTSACKGKTPADGNKLVALVLDYGTAADAPKGEHPPHGVVATCVEVPKNGDGFAVLSKADVGVRIKAGLICGLNGYPKTECAPAVTASASPTAKPSATKSSPRPSPSKPPASPPDRSSSSSGAATHSATVTPDASASDVASVVASARSVTGSPSTPPAGPSSDLAAAAASSGSSSSTDATAEAAPSLVVGDVAADSDSGGSPWALIIGGAVLVLILGAAGLRSRWNR